MLRVKDIKPGQNRIIILDGGGFFMEKDAYDHLTKWGGYTRRYENLNPPPDFAWAGFPVKKQYLTKRGAQHDRRRVKPYIPVITIFRGLHP